METRGQTEQALRQAERELKWWLIELEHTKEALQRARRQRARLRDQVAAMSEALALSLSERYWAEQSGSSAKRRLFARNTVDPEAELVREVEASDLFDAGWYLRHHHKAVSSGLAPALHYVRHGNRKRLDPGPRFSTGDYLTRHPEAAKDALPALLHAQRHGQLPDARPDTAEAPTSDLHL